ncbi:hydroxyacylglutathione hydrolase cytoplasmic-like isoform X2 [Primulina huaijiensis]|uniref:hydroxyacylglutathione hydrolase cytoplasmic-like isoform X2 n=1 Tax=Primulina huaijiensis TaxID=1492673 RepID=UPI003CC729C9
MIYFHVTSYDGNLFLEVLRVSRLCPHVFMALIDHPYKRSYKFLCHWQRGRGSCCLTGDTLLAVGSFLNALLSRCINHCVTLSSLPEPTQVYCGHEYSVKKLQFSCEELAVYFDSRTRKCEDLSKIKWAEQKRKEGLPTIPSSIEEELETNPFMCVDLPEVQAYFYVECGHERLGCAGESWGTRLQRITGEVDPQRRDKRRMQVCYNNNNAKFFIQL